MELSFSWWTQVLRWKPVRVDWSQLTSNQKTTITFNFYKLGKEGLAHEKIFIKESQLYNNSQ